MTQHKSRAAARRSRVDVDDVFFDGLTFYPNFAAKWRSGCTCVICSLNIDSFDWQHLSVNFRRAHSEETQQKISQIFLSHKTVIILFAKNSFCFVWVLNCCSWVYACCVCTLHASECVYVRRFSFIHCEIESASVLGWTNHRRLSLVLDLKVG